MTGLLSWITLLALSSLSLSAGFVTPQTTAAARRSRTASSLTSANLLPIPHDDASAVLPLLEDVVRSSSQIVSKLLLKEIDPEIAKPQFFFLFFAGSGAGGIGLSRIPAILEEVSAVKSLAAQGPTAGGETLQTSPIVSVLYPRKLSSKDVQQVIAKIPSSAKINKQGSSESYFAKVGYVVQEDFYKALKGCNPLTVAAAYEALSGGGGKCVNPDTVDEKVQEWRNDKAKMLTAFSSDLQKAVISKLGAYATLFILLFITFDLIVETGINAFLV